MEEGTAGPVGDRQALLIMQFLLMASINGCNSYDNVPRDGRIPIPRSDDEARNADIHQHEANLTRFPSFVVCKLKML